MRGVDLWRASKAGDAPLQSGALKNHLKYCRENICECISTFMQKQNGGGSGLAERFARMMGPNAVQTGIPTHVDQIQGRQDAMQEAMRAYEDQGCGGPGAPQHAPVPQGALDNMNRPIPTQEDWEAENGRPMPEGDYQPGQGNNNLDLSEYKEEAAAGLTVGAVLYGLWQLARLYPPRNLIPF
jgi:hypothetical protein